jgi:hypothetical protein
MLCKYTWRKSWFVYLWKHPQRRLLSSISKSETENEIQEHNLTLIGFQCQGKTSLGERKQKDFFCKISREKSIIHSTDIYLVPTISTKERYSGEKTIKGPCGHGNCMSLKQRTTVIWNLKLPLPLTGCANMGKSLSPSGPTLFHLLKWSGEGKSIQRENANIQVQ